MEYLLSKFFRCIVGPEYGFSGEGNEQWFYSVALAIDIMLAWILSPDVALSFTIIAAFHYFTVFVYGYFDLDFGEIGFAIAYLLSHVVLLVIAFIINCRLALITTIIPIVFFLICPDCVGDSIITSRLKIAKRFPLLLNTIVLAAFIVVDFFLPIKLWYKIMIIVIALLVHPVIDYLEGDCVIISDVTYDTYGKIIKAIHRKFKR